MSKIQQAGEAVAIVGSSEDGLPLIATYNMLSGEIEQYHHELKEIYTWYKDNPDLKAPAFQRALQLHEKLCDVIGHGAPCAWYLPYITSLTSNGVTNALAATWMLKIPVSVLDSIKKSGKHGIKVAIVGSVEEGFPLLHNENLTPSEKSKFNIKLQLLSGSTKDKQKTEEAWAHLLSDILTEITMPPGKKSPGTSVYYVPMILKAAKDVDSKNIGNLDWWPGVPKELYEELKDAKAKGYRTVVVGQHENGFPVIEVHGFTFAEKLKIQKTLKKLAKQTSADLPNSTVGAIINETIKQIVPPKSMVGLMTWYIPYTEELVAQKKNAKLTDYLDPKMKVQYQATSMPFCNEHYKEALKPQKPASVEKSAADLTKEAAKELFMSMKKM